MKWTKQHDLELVKEILTERPFDHAKGSRQIGLVWQKIMDNLNTRTETRFCIKDIRAVRDRFSLLQKKYKRQMREEITASGIEVGEPSELDLALEEAVMLFESEDEEREKNRTAKEEEKIKAEEVRRVAVESIKETNKRKSETELSSSSGSFKSKKAATLTYLMEKADKEINVRKMEVQQKEKELEVRKLELELKNKQFEIQQEQNKQMMELLMTLAKKN